MSKVMLDCGSSASLYDVIGLEKVHRPFNQSDEKTKTNHDAWAWSLWFLTCFILWYDFATFKVEKCLWKKCKPFMRRILLLIFFAGSGTKIMKLVCRPAFCFVTWRFLSSFAGTEVQSYHQLRQWAWVHMSCYATQARFKC